MPAYNGPNGIVRATGKLAAVFDADPAYSRIVRTEPTAEPRAKRGNDKEVSK